MPVYRLLKRILFGANSKNFPNFAKIPISTKKAVKTENLKEMVKDIKKMSKTAENIFRDNDFKKSILFQSLSYFVIGCGAIYITTRLSDETFINHMNQKSSFFSEWLTEDFHRKNPGKVNDETKILKDISFEDVCGNEEAKEELAVS